MTSKRRVSVPVVRCAVYTRKSTEEGLDQEYNSLDAQRDSGEAYVRSQAGEGWVCLADRYDDGGFTGGNTDRPALRRLLADVEAGKVDCVVVYKVDRLSRSLLDFAGMMALFERHKVAFVSVTQQFNTASSMGRLILNVLLSFAQFEREIISERTRDKMAATRRKGKWAGGTPVLGYDLDRERSRLVVNEAEAERVRAIFDLYLEHEALLPVVRELERRGWTNKLWGDKGGKAFTRTSLHRLLTSALYGGRVRYKGELHQGEHPPILDGDTWERAQAILRRNRQSGGAWVRNGFGSFLKGLLHCGACGCAMTPTHSTRNGRRYRYYVCVKAQKKGWDTCPSKAIPAAQIERFVLDEVRVVGSDQDLQDQTLRQAREQSETLVEGLEAQKRTLDRDLARWQGELQRLPRVQGGQDAEGGELLGRWRQLQEQIAQADRQRSRVREQLCEARRQQIDEEMAREALTAFEPLWEQMGPREQARLAGLLVERVDYDGSKGTVRVTFQPNGIQALADELAPPTGTNDREMRA